jgi:heptosyltransferase-2
VQIVRDLSLPHLGALLGRSQLFIGHDSGISHLAAAAGAPCLLLFGPTDPGVWAPINAGVRVLEAPNGDLGQLTVETVVKEIAAP